MPRVLAAQELAKAVSTSVGSDNIFAMMRGGKLHMKKMYELTKALVASWQPAFRAEAIEAMPTVLADCAEDIQKFARGLFCLLSPFPLYNIAPTDVTEVLEYAGKSSLLTYAKARLNEKFWQSQWNEVLAKFVATKDAAAIVEQAEIDVCNRPVDVNGLCSALAVYGQLKDEVRSGALTFLLSKLHAALHELAGGMIENEAEGYSMSTFEQIVQGFGLFTDAPSFNMAAKLEKLKGKVSERLVLTDLRKLLDDYPDHEVEGGGDRDCSASLDCLFESLQAASSLKMPDDMLLLAQRALFWHFRSLHFMLQDICCSCVWRMAFLSD